LWEHIYSFIPHWYPSANALAAMRRRKLIDAKLAKLRQINISKHFHIRYFNLLRNWEIQDLQQAEEEEEGHWLGVYMYRKNPRRVPYF